MKRVKFFVICGSLALATIGYLFGAAKVGEREEAEISLSGSIVDGAVYRLRNAPGVLVSIKNGWLVFVGFGGDKPRISVAPNAGYIDVFGAFYRLRPSPIEFLDEGIEPLPTWKADAKWEDDGASFTIPGQGGGRVHLRFHIPDETT